MSPASQFPSNPSTILDALNGSLCIAVIEPSGIIRSVNDKFRTLFGYESSEICGCGHSDLVEPRQIGSDEYRTLWINLRAGRPAEFQHKRCAKGGRDIWVFCSYTPIVNDAGNVTEIVEIVTDRTAERLQAMEYEAKLNAISRVQAIIEFRPGGEVITANDRFLELFGYELCEIAGKSHALFVEPFFVRTQDYDDLWRRLNAGEYISADFKRLGKSGKTIWIQASYNPIFDLDGHVIRIIKFATDITERKRSALATPPLGLMPFFPSAPLGEAGGEKPPGPKRHQQELAFMAFHDGLTGLENRIAFNEALVAALDKAKSVGQRLAVAILDLDRFKEVNDSFGHAAGDKVLQEVARRLTDVIGLDERIARFGGDEFAFFKIFQDQADLDTSLNSIQSVVLAPIYQDQMEVMLGVSIGVAVFPDDDERSERLLSKADMAMYRSKAENGRSVFFYTREADDADRYEKTLTNEIRYALKRQELTLFYQVQKSIRTGEIVGYEALLRWKHPVLGSVSPSDFIPIAEKTGLIISIGRWVLQEACREAAFWKGPSRIAVNLSAVQFSDEGLVGYVRETLMTTGLAPHRLEMEVTETAVISDSNAALNTLRQLKSLGVKIAMDDFGTGYSSLATLSAFPFDKIKIDRSFLLEADARPQALAIIRTILGLGRSLKLPILAEGVETGEQLAMLRAEGCEEAQGFLLGRPGPIDQDEKLEIRAA